MTRRPDRRSAHAAAYRPLYRTREWRELRADQLRRHPYCAECARQGRRTLATVVHHIRRHNGNTTLFFDPGNLESACQPCHDGPLQSRERLGYTKGVDGSGRPVDAGHPWNR